MPPSSSPPPARPGPPWTRCGTGEPCPVEVRAFSRLRNSTRPLKAPIRLMSSTATSGSSVATLVTSDPPPRSTSSAASAIVEYASTLATGPNASTSWTASAEASVNPTRIGVMKAPSGAGPIVPSARTTSGASDEPSRMRPPAASSAATCRSTSSRCSSETSGPIVTDSARGSPITTRSSIFASQRLDEGVDRALRHDRTADRRALLPGLRRELDQELLHVGVEFGRAGRSIRPEDRRVDRVGLAREPHAGRGLIAQLRRRRRAAGEADEVAEPQVVEQRRHAAADELQRSVGQQPRLDEDPHPRLGDVAGRCRGLDDGSEPRRGTPARTSRARPTSGS